MRLVLARSDPRSPGEYPRLEWQEPLEVHPAQPSELDGCLGEFIRLREGSPQAVEAFAQRWGVLSICETHEQFSSRQEDACAPHIHGRGYARGWTGGKGPVYWEPLAAWWRYADQLRALINTVVALVREDRPAPDDWKIVADAIRTGWHGSDRGAMLYRDLLRQSYLGFDQYRRCVAFLLDGWLDHAGVRPRIEWRAGEPRVTLSLGGPSLLAGILAVQLAAVITSPLNMWHCDGCGDLYREVSHRPAAGRLHFCPECGVGDRASKRAWYHRNRAKQIASGERSL
jgi:hypothetical protein